MEDDLLGFEAIECLPEAFNLRVMNDGSGIRNTLISTNAKWHNTYMDSLNSINLDQGQGLGSQG